MFKLRVLKYFMHTLNGAAFNHVYPFMDSDEVVGHIFAYSILVDIFKNDAVFDEIHLEALQLLDDIMTYIVKNDFYLIDVTGLPTSWGSRHVLDDFFRIR